MNAIYTQAYRDGQAQIGAQIDLAAQMQGAKYLAAYYEMAKSLATRFQLLGGMRAVNAFCYENEPTTWWDAPIYVAYIKLVDTVDKAPEDIFARCDRFARSAVTGFTY